MASNGFKAAVESRLPGRIRLRVPRESRRADALSKVESVLRDLEGVVQVAGNLLTGSVLVDYDPARTSGDSLIDAGRQAGVVDGAEPDLLPCDVDWPAPSITAQSVLEGFRKIDSAVCRITRGTVDAKMGVSLLLFGTSVGRLLLSEHRRPVPWHSLLWYSYSLFVHWHRPHGDGTTAG